MDRYEDGDWSPPVELAAAPAPSRRVTWSEEVGEAICGRLAAGESLMAVCRDEGMPHHSTVREWGWRRPAFGEALLEAMRAARLRRRRADLARAMRPRDARGLWSTYSHALGAEICRRLVEGETLIAVCRDEAMPCYSTVLNWARAVPEFGEAYARARRLAADYLFDEARELALAAKPGTVWVDRLKFQVIRWQVARLAPRKYVEEMPEAEVSQAQRARARLREGWQNAVRRWDEDDDDD
jgi:hypothetical protein